MAQPQRRSRFRAAVDGITDVPDGPPVTTVWLSQMGRLADREPFREEPRWGSELEVSTVQGRHDAEETVRAVLGCHRPGFSVRHLPVEQLSQAEYLCLQTPHRKRPLHASIAAPVQGTDMENHRLWWQAPERVRLVQMATDPEGLT